MYCPLLTLVWIKSIALQNEVDFKNMAGNAELSPAEHLKHSICCNSLDKRNVMSEYWNGVIPTYNKHEVLSTRSVNAFLKTNRGRNCISYKTRKIGSGQLQMT